MKNSYSKWSTRSIMWDITNFCNVGLVALSGISVQIVASISSVVWGASCFSIQISIWQCGNPRFWNSMTCILAVVYPRTWRFSISWTQFFLVEYSGNYIWPIGCCLIAGDVVSHFFPLWIAGKCQEESGLAVLPADCHCITVVFSLLTRLLT